MSEPYSVFLRANIRREQLQRYLAAERKRARTYDDWNRCDGFIDISSFQNKPDLWTQWLASADIHTGGTYAEAYRRIRRQDTPSPLFRFYYDDDTSALTQASLWYSQSADELVEHLSVTRGICDFLDAEQRGFTAVHDPFLGNGTVGVIELEQGNSRVVEINDEHEAALAAVIRELSGAGTDLSTIFDANPTAEQLEQAIRDELASFSSSS